MAVLAERIETGLPKSEIYARSLSTIRAAGAVAIEHASKPEAEMQGAYVELSFDDLNDAAAEMLKTDKKYGKYLEINKNKIHKVIGGKTRTASGEPLIDLVTRGADASEAEARKNPALKAQANLDRQQVEYITAVDKLEVGQSVFLFGEEPKEAIDDDEDIYGKRLGYEKGRGHIFSATRVSKDSVVLRTSSIDTSNMNVWEDIFDDLGEDVSQIIRTTFSSEEADQFIDRLRSEYKKRRADTSNQFSANEYVDSKQKIVQGIFDTYYASLSHAVYTGKNNDVLKGLASSLLQGGDKDFRLDPELRRVLIKVSNSVTFSDESGRKMNEVLRYAVVEEVRKGLDSFIGLTPEPRNLPPQNYLTQGRVRERAYVPLESSHHLMAGNVITGVRENRSYGGCSGGTKLGSNSEAGDNLATVTDLLEYREQNNESSRGNSRGSRSSKITCIKCRKPSPASEVIRPESWRCPHCKYEVDVCTGKVKHKSEPKENIAPITSLGESRRDKQGKKQKIAKVALSSIAA